MRSFPEDGSRRVLLREYEEVIGVKRLIYPIAIVIGGVLGIFAIALMVRKPTGESTSPARDPATTENEWEGEGGASKEV